MNEKTWSTPEIQAFSTANDFKVSPFYADGKTYGTPTWIWSVTVNGRLYIRAWNGQNSRWYQSAIQQQQGRIFLAGANHDVTFAKCQGADLNDLIDQAYQAKYQGSPYLPPMIQAGPRSATVEVSPK